MRIVFVMTLIGSIGLVILAVWPGMIENVIFGFPFACIWLPVLAIWCLFTIILAIRDLESQSKPALPRRWLGLVSAIIMFGTLGLLWLRVPQRVAFAMCYSDFRNLVDVAPADAFAGKESGPRLGPYRVDRYAADKRGGVFFRTATGQPRIGPDQMSYGFVFRPNGRGTPFGNAGCRQCYLFGDWYSFAVSDDW